jgi:hypothetical protein
MQVGGGLLRVNGRGRWLDPVGGGLLQVEVDAGVLIRSPVDCYGTRSSQRRWDMVAGGLPSEEIVRARAGGRRSF